MKRRRAYILQRPRVFLGCEGKSERGYGELIRNLLQDQGKTIHIHCEAFRGGEPLDLVERCVEHIHQIKMKRDPYKLLALLLDADRRGQSKIRDARAAALARRNQIRLIWQEPCHEAVLLRHLPGCTRKRPTTTNDALLQIEKVWPEYDRPMTAERLRERIDYDGVLRAITVEMELAQFLQDIQSL
jgi:hypothetical protein